MFGYLTQGAHTTCAQKESGSVPISLMIGSVMIGNDVVRKTVDIGNIRMRMFDGQIRTFTNVRYVPYLRNNLLSL